MKKTPIFRFLLLCLIASLAAGCSKSRPAQPETGAPFVQGENLAFAQKIDADQQNLRQKILSSPDVTENYLRRSELLQILGKNQQALEVLQQALAKSQPTSAQKKTLIHRLVLLQALKLDRPDLTVELLPQLPPDSFLRFDAEAVISIGQNRPRAALESLEQAAALANSHDEQALNLYHQALAFHQMGDETRAVTALYHAINSAENRRLIKDIERLWVILDTQNP